MAKFKDKYRIESSRLKGWDYRQGYYFVTICTKDRLPFFDEIIMGEMHLSSIGDIIAEEWLRTGIIRSSAILDEWVIMPNHFHGILVLQSTGNATYLQESETSSRDASIRLLSGSLGAIINQVKSICTKWIWVMGRTDFGWQTRFYDLIIRNDESSNKIREYITNNPLKWELDKLYIKA